MNSHEGSVEVSVRNIVPVEFAVGLGDKFVRIAVPGIAWNMLVRNTA